MDNYIGTYLDNRYEILEQIGSGGMAVVYKARCHRLNRLVAVKILKDEFSKDDEFRRRFHAESQAVAMLSHPNIVSVYDVSHSGNVDYIVMELIEGITLKEYMQQKGTLSWREALHFATQIAKALEHAHSRGIVHRDIKPHNIMVLKDGSVKVADFGIAYIASAQNTLTREALGSVHYISPEQAKGAQVDCRADLYSLGVVMYEMLTGRPPYDGDTPVSVAIQHISSRPVPPRELNASIPLGLEQITMHAMTAELSGRYASASQMLRDLEEFRKDPDAVFDFSARPGDIDVERLLNDPDYLPNPNEKSSVVRRASEKPPLPPSGGAAETAQPRRSSRVAVIAGVVCIALAVLAIVYFLYTYFISGLFTKTEEDAVPTLIGMRYDELRAEDYPNFKLVLGEQRSSTEYDAGIVMDQSPAAGRSAKVGSSITLIVSAGSEQVRMPQLVNESLQSAQAILEALNIAVKLDVSYENSSVYTDGYVISTDPAAEQPLSSGQTVHLTVSMGPSITLIEVPTLVGEDVDEALRRIQACGLSQGSLRYDESDLPAGTVTFQSVEAGAMVKPETVVNLRVSKGPTEAQKPVITYLSGDSTVRPGDTLVLRCQASTEDDGVLSYAWYVTETGSADQATLVSRGAENNTTCPVDTNAEGVYYYFCTVVNTLDDTKASVDSDMIEVVVAGEQKPVEKEISFYLPQDAGVYSISVRVGGEEQIAAFDYDNRQAPTEPVLLRVSGVGTLPVDIYVDGELYESQMIIFEEEERQ